MADPDRSNVLDALADLKGVVPGELGLRIGGKFLEPEFVLRILDPFVSDERRQRFDEVIAGRTKTVVAVVEGAVNMGNVSAVMRTAEGLGYQELHLVTGTTRFKNSRRTSTGAEKWLDVYHWQSPTDCASALKRNGYSIVAAHLDATAKSIDRFDFTKRTALVFGNERDGISSEMLSLADERCILPMAGFAQSYNISVAAAIALYHSYTDRVRRLGRHGDLSHTEALRLRAAYYINSVRRGEDILRQAVQRQDT